MRDTDGFEFLNAVRVASPKFKIIAISGFLNGHNAFGCEDARRDRNSRQAILSRIAAISRGKTAARIVQSRRPVNPERGGRLTQNQFASRTIRPNAGDTQITPYAAHNSR